jgi:hypothetical protein
MEDEISNKSPDTPQPVNSSGTQQNVNTQQSNTQQPFSNPIQPQNTNTSQSSPPQSTQTPVVEKKSKIGFVFGGLSFIPLIGVLFGLIAIVIGITQKLKGPIFLGLAGILFSVILYGGLYYFGIVAKTGPWADLKAPLAEQQLNQNKGQILSYKDNTGQPPSDLNSLPSEYTIYPQDPWFNDFIYSFKNDGTFEISSAGPDGIANTNDDVFPSN